MPARVRTALLAIAIGSASAVSLATLAGAQGGTSTTTPSTAGPTTIDPSPVPEPCQPFPGCTTTTTAPPAAPVPTVRPAGTGASAFTG